MALSKTVEKLDKYYGRLKTATPRRSSLPTREGDRKAQGARAGFSKKRFQKTQKESKKERLERKLRKTQELTERAKWLLNEIA